MKTAGLVKQAPTAQYEGEMPVPLRRAYDYAESEVADTAALAAELFWRPVTVTRLLGGGTRPKLGALL